MDIVPPPDQDRMPVLERIGWRLREVSTQQWMILIVMAGLLLAVCATLILVLRSEGLGSVDVFATALAGPTSTPTPPALVPDAVPTSSALYWPPDPQPRSTPNAPGGLLWWDARFAYRRPVLLDVVASGAPAGMWARVIFDGEGAQRAGKMRGDGNDLRVVVWDGFDWWEIPRHAQPRRERRGWNVFFHLQDPEVGRSGHIYLYYGNPMAEPPPGAEDAPETSRLLLSLGEEQGVEWGPVVTWTANSTTTQALVSPDGRIVIHHPPGGPSKNVRVRLRTVPVGERNGYGPLPDYELHADPPPSPPDRSNVVRWHPPLTVEINWASLPVDVRGLESWVHFAYNTDMGRWYSVPVEFDKVRGSTRVITDQP